jgi:hypothetical protein
VPKTDDRQSPGAFDRRVIFRPFLFDPDRPADQADQKVKRQIRQTNKDSLFEGIRGQIGGFKDLLNFFVH